MQQLVKLLKAVDLLARPEGITKKEIAETLEVSERQVNRIINSIEDLGFPVYGDKDPLETRKRWKLDKGYVKKLPNITIPDIQFTAAELISLYLLRGDEKIYRGTDIEKKINSAFYKVGMFLPEGAADQLKKIKTLFVPAAKFTKDYSDKEDIIDQLTEAILKQKTCSVSYHSFSSDEVKDFTVDPLHFFEHDGGLYIFVRLAKHKNIITLAIERIRKLVVGEDSFEYPGDFDPEEILDSSFGIIDDTVADFKIWFSATQARYVKERRWDKTQKIEDQKDGSIILTMRTAGVWNVKQWVLSYGPQAELLEPEALRKEIASELKEGYEKYQTEKH